MREDFQNQLEALSLLIRAGRGDAARTILSRLAKKRRLPRTQLAELARLCWRANLPDTALRLLYPIVRSSGKRLAIATDKEKAEYGVSLIKTGQIEEGLHLLREVSIEKYPHALLYEAFGYISRWDYPSSIPVLTRYRDCPEVCSYQRLVCDVNLIAAYVFISDFSKAMPLIEQALGTAAGPELGLLRGRILELKAEALIGQNELEWAQDTLVEAEAALADQGSIDHFFIRKYKAILRFLSDPGEPSVELLSDIRTEAMEKRHWETVRDLDRIAAVRLQDSRRFERLFFGTPFEAFRQMLLEQKPLQFELPAHYDRNLFSSSSVGPVLDLDGKTFKGQALSGFKEGMANHRLIAALASDAYRPFPAPSLFAAAFPGEKHIPGHSGVRLRKALSRLRQWLTENAIPLEITDSEDGYRIAASGPLRIRLRSETKAAFRSWELMRRLRDQIGEGSPFSSERVAAVLSISRRAAQRLLASDPGKAQLEKRERGVYQFPTSSIRRIG